MLASQQKPIKQGWLLKKAGTGLIAPWRSKFVVITASRDTDGDHEILVYDQRDLSFAPKHKILLSECSIDVPKKTFSRLKKGAVPFAVFANSRKSEFDQWMLLIEQVRHESHQFRPASRQKNYDDWDARSVYSVATTAHGAREDDMVSVVSTASRYTPFPQDADIESLVSNVDTLSFYNEPILSPYELTTIAEGGSSVAQKGDRETVIKRRGRIPTMTEPFQTANWNEKFQEIVEKPAITEEAALQKDIQLVELIGNFQESATNHARNMIDEYHIFKRKEGRDEKYSVTSDMSCLKDGIILQFACNYNDCSPEEIELAHSDSSGELCALDMVARATAESEDKKLRNVLMALIDYKGFRVIAHANMSGHAMQLLHDLNPDNLLIEEQAVEYTKSLGVALNLQSHTVQVSQDRRVRIYLAAAVEIHMDKNTQTMYLSSLKDILPLDCHNSLHKTEALQRGCRLRPEFLKAYQHSLCSGALTPTSGATKTEVETNDAALIRASRFLRESWIPGFIKSLDILDIRPFDSRSLTVEMHQKGINMRYLGMICERSAVPFVRNLALTEMVARASKHAFQSRLREAILHFRSVGATNIEREMEVYAVGFFTLILSNTDKSRTYFHSQIQPDLAEMFNYTLSEKQYANIHRPALFLALQYHCGATFSDSCHYDFTVRSPLQISNFIQFHSRSKTLSGVPKVPGTSLQEEEQLSYNISRHFKAIGKKEKLRASNGSATALVQVASYFNSISRYEEAKLYSRAAMALSAKNSVLFALASAQLFYALAGLQQNPAYGGIEEPETTVLKLYQQALLVSNWHWGPDNLISMTFHDRMSMIAHKLKNAKKAAEYHKLSLDVAIKALGNNHSVTASYLTRYGCYLFNLGRLEDSISQLTQAAQIFTSTQSSPSLIAEVHYHFSECMAERGDLEGAIHHAQKCRKIRERIFGLLDVRVMESCRQTARMVLAPFKEYSGVLTPQIKQSYREAIQCHEKVFRFLQQQKSRLRKANTLRKRQSVRSMVSMKTENEPPIKETVPHSYCGPLVISPFGWAPPLNSSMLHKLTKEIVSMKLSLVELPKHRDCIRQFRARRELQAKERENGNETVGAFAFDEEDARSAILRMAAVTPSVYLDDILHRIEQDDQGAINELGLVMTLTESETVGVIV